ncbi:MAG TPA: MopE-related protein [Solirubrobacterales bacterium]
MQGSSFGSLRVLALRWFAPLAVLLVAADAAWAAPINDNFAQRLPMQLGFADTRSNAEAGIEAGERLTVNDPDGFGCNKQGEAAAGGIKMERTLWWEFTGNGGSITVSTLASNFDTVLAVYEADSEELISCNDDVQTRDPTRPNLPARLGSEVVVDTDPGKTYAVQVGGCTPPEACGTASSGTITLRISAAPANDNRVDARPIVAGAPVAATNTGATLEPGEGASCGGHLYAKTVWFRYTAPAVGTAAFSAAGFDTVLAVYRDSSTVALGCNDEALGEQFGGSRVPSIQPPEPPVPVTPGDYLIQVGGYYDVGFSTIAARNGPLAVQVEFVPDPDLDDDGVTSARDCDESNPAIRPGVPEAPNNDVDENCDGLKAFDRDGDGVLDSPLGRDCDDENPQVRPEAAEVPGNQLDENCDTKTPDWPELPTGIAIDVKRYESFSWLIAYRLRDLLPGSLVEIRCDGDNCPYEKKRHPVRQARGLLLLPAGFRLKPGDSVVVRVSKPGHRGSERSFRIRRGKRYLVRTNCLDPAGQRIPC